ncbi:MAG: sugar kinase [Alkalilacustris sp.]
MQPGLILSIGEAMVELSPAEAPELWRLGIAGDTLNTAWYLRGLLGPDWRVGYLSRVGTGPFSRRMVDFLTAAGIGTAHVSRDPAREIGLYAIELTDGERSFSYWREASAARGLAADAGALEAALAEARLAYLSGITLAILPAQDRARLLDRLAAARGRGVRVVFDPNLRPRLWETPEAMRAGVEAAAPGADLVLPSFDDEAAQFGDADPAATVARYLDLGAAEVVVKNAGGPVRFGAADGTGGTVTGLERATPVDSTAAGDSFNAGYLAARLEGAGQEDAIRAGHALGRAVIGHRGALVPEALETVRRA